MPKNIPALDLMGIPVHKISSEELLEFIKRSIKEQHPANLLHLNLHGVCLALRHAWLREFYRRDHLLFCDGEAVRWGLRFLGMKPPPKIPLTRWIWKLAAFSEEEGFRLFFLGSKPGIVEEAVRRLKARHPDLQIAGFHHGYFNKQGQENEEVLAQINKAKADILIVCFGMPEQEKWILDNNNRLHVPVRIPSGGTLDYVAGRLGKAPQWMIRLHLEWLFRIMQEPRRLLGRYLTEIPYFLFRMLAEKFRRTFILPQSQKAPPGSFLKKS